MISVVFIICVLVLPRGECLMFPVSMFPVFFFLLSVAKESLKL